jgi:microsomal epoxide hydrolase
VELRIRAIALPLFLVFGCVAIPQTARAQDVFRDGRFTTSDGVELHYIEAGSGPTLVFVPGWTMPAEIWEAQLRHFAPKYHVVALDPRGQGRSEKPSWGYVPARRAQDIGELLEHLGNRPAILVGWSLGVQEVLVYTHEFGTDAVRAVVLVDYEVNWESPQLTQRFVSLQTDREAWTRRFIEAIHARPQPEEYLEAMTRAALSTPTNAAAIMIANLMLMGPTDLTSALEALNRPVLLVFSSLDWAVAEAERIRETWPDLPVEVIDNTSHALFVDEPEEFNQALESFLSTVEE